MNRERRLLQTEQVERPNRIDQLDPAQTIVQLLTQMARLGYPLEARELVQQAYGVATALAPAVYRASGRPLSAHLAGTASVLAAFGANPEVLVAALLHTAYAFGQFPDDSGQDVEAMRRWLRRRIGPAAEELVYRYSRLSLEEVSSYAAGDLDRMPTPLAHAVLIRIASRIDDRALGDDLFFDSAQWLAESNAQIERCLPCFTQIAERLNVGELAAILRECVTRAQPDSPQALRIGRPLTYSIEPGSGKLNAMHSRSVDGPAPSGSVDDSRPRLDTRARWIDQGADVASAIYLIALAAFAAWYMWPSLFRVWFFSSDEYVFAAEVIRFLNLDFRQQFFDMPGTPLMFVSAAAWTLYYVLQGGPLHVALDAFTFERLPQLFVLMRGITLVGYCASVVLVFMVARRLLNRAAGWTAALILAMSPTYTSYSSFVRVESLSVCLILVAILILLRVIERQRWSTAPPSSALWDWVFAAGVLAGLAAATRLHSITASVPVLALILLTHPVAPRIDYPKWTKVLLSVAAVAIGVALAVVFLAARTFFEPYPHSKRLISVALIAGAGTLALGALLYRWHGSRKTLLRIASPELIRLLFGCGVGFLLGTPTILRQFRYFFNSIDMYSTNYLDLARAGMPFWEHLNWYVRLYLKVAAGDAAVLALLILGTIGILIRRDRRLLPFLAGAVLFFVSKPLNIRPEAHHIMTWLPFYAIVCSYPVAVAWNTVAHRVRYGPILAPAVFVVLFPALWLSVTKGPAVVATMTPVTEERLANVLRATDWIKRTTEPGSTIAVSYFCFNPPVFYRWLGSMGVPVAQSALDGRDYLIWWGHARALDGKTGYACATRSDVDHMSTGLNRSEPGQGTDPYSDKRFQIVQSFGSGLAEVNVFRFDYRH